MEYRKCPQCGKEFLATTWNRMYCSAKCARNAQARQNMSHIIRRSAIRAVIPQKLLYAFYFSCCICGWHLPQKINSINYQPQYGCDFHHIVPISDGGENELDNIVLLCPNCHKLAHAGVISKEELREQTKTMEEAERKREFLAMETGLGTYWVDYVYLNKGNFRKRLAKGEDI